MYKPQPKLGNEAPFRIKHRLSIPSQYLIEYKIQEEKDARIMRNFLRGVGVCLALIVIAVVWWGAGDSIKTILGE